MRRVVCLAALFVCLCAPVTAQRPAPKPSTGPAASGAQAAWPRPVPARVKDGVNPDVFAMTLGPVVTALADGTFDPAQDRLTLRDGTVMPHYYRDTLGVKFYQPIDKSIFPLPPSGLCTWYYYYQDINDREVRLNARWIADHLEDYGAKYVQIDDGWQAETKDGKHGSRDWTGVDKHFPGGMASLAAYIKSLGLTPGLWIAPHGQSNEDVVKAHPGVFMLKPDGTSASETWEGKWLVDGSAPAAHAYLRDLFTTLRGWGYEYFKIDGQPIVPEEYAAKNAFLRTPGEADALYRQTLETIRGAIGPHCYLLGCWGLPIEGVGYMNGSRTGGDVVGGWPGFATALEPTLNAYYLHNIVWYTDPDVMLLRPPLTLDQARVWATLQGLTGQALMASDRMMDLSDERVELLRRVYPAVDIRPLDLFPTTRHKRIWDLKVNHLGRQYDVVGVFNFEEGTSNQVYVAWKDLGLEASGPVHVFDFWHHEYLGAWENGIAVTAAPTSVQVLTLVPATDRIQLVSTSRHITQGWVDLVRLDTDATGTRFTGRSHLVKQDPYELAFAFPRGKHFAIRRASAHSAAGSVPVRFTNHQGWATVRIDPATTTDVDWLVEFEPADGYSYGTREPGGLRAERLGLDGVMLRWSAQYYLNMGYQVYLDGNLLGRTGDTSFPLRGLDPARAYSAEVRAVWEDGSVGPRHKISAVSFSLRSMLPDELPLASLEPSRFVTQEWGGGVATGTISVGGKRHEQALTAEGGSEIEYDVRGLYTMLVAQVGLASDASGAVKVTVLADGKEVWASPVLTKTTGLIDVQIPVGGVSRLILRSVAAGEPPDRSGPPPRRDGLAAGWINARLEGPVSPK
jgi:hypothetical protein